ncbi:MAG: Aldolase, partial [Marmoricola sp.]|nr:Aldolase [Marmoricola sp.]
MTNVDIPVVGVRNPALPDAQWQSLLRTRATDPLAIARAYDARARASGVLSERDTLFL